MQILNNAMQGPVSNLSNPQVLESAVKLGNVKVNPRTGQTPAKMIVKKKVSPAKQMTKSLSARPIRVSSLILLVFTQVEINCGSEAGIILFVI